VTEHIGIYRVERPIGRGGMGEVLLAWDDRLERRVAIKRVRRDAGLSPEQRERFRREARLAARLSHSAVVQIYDLVTGDAGDADDAIVMEYVEGRTLAERLAEGPLVLGMALRLAEEIAQGLAAAHAAGLVHRDLKAANVVVTPAGHAKILDFGLARPAVRRPDEMPLTRQGFVIGTFNAMSPEQARGEEVDARSDLFSLGILLYEMVTGQAPFRGADPAEILKKIVQEPPPDPRSLRPDLPPEVGDLLHRLLAKDRGGRPGSAEEVAEILEGLRSGSGVSPLSPAIAVSVSDLPTSQVPRSEPVPPASSAPSVSGSRRRTGLTVSAALLLGVIAAMVLFKGPAAAPLRVAIAPIEILPADDPQLVLAGSGVVTAALAGLTSLEKIAPIDPREASRGGRLPVDMARTAAADEVLTSEIRRDGAMGRVTLRRVQGSDGRVLWTETFPVPIGSGGLRLLSDAVAIKLQKGYSGHDLRPGVPSLDVRDADYAEFLKVQQRIQAGTTPLDPDLERLERIVRDNPRFLEAQLLTGQVAHALFVARRNPADLDRAAALARQARELAPNDPRPVRLDLQVALAAQRTGDAAAILDRIERLLPGDPELLPLRARLAEQQGRWEASLAALQAAAEQAPGWQNLYRLAYAEARYGRIEDARRHLDTILRQAPDNLWAREALAHLELVYGDLARAERIYLECASAVPRRAYTNLGVARSLHGRYREAADAYRRALAVEPDHVFTLISLADAFVELGAPGEAEALYRRALARLEGAETPAGPAESMLKAQCLARLGRSREAVETAQAALRRNPDDADLLYQSAIVLSLAGDRSSALSNALAALDKGVQPRWFSGSTFAWLRETPEMRPYLTPVSSSPLPRPDRRAADRPTPRAAGL
jgi:serine/threonine-protein kinase